MARAKKAVEVEEVIEAVEVEDKEYIVIRSFTDLKDNDKVYYNGNPFEGSEERVKELLSTKNKQGHAVIKEV